MLIAPNGHAHMHSLHKMHLSVRTTTAFVFEFLVIALVGQTTIHGAGSHCSQMIGTLRHSLSFLGIHMRDCLGLNTPSFLKEHATMQDLQPVHESRSIDSVL
jgi:hypothetical protein